MANEKLGIVGGGQLAMMMTYEAIALGYEVTVIDPKLSCPAAQAGAQQIQASFMNGDAIRELAKRVDVITLDLEHINTDALMDIPIPFSPSPVMLALVKDKLEQKRYLQSHGIPVADFRNVETQFDLNNSFSRFGSVIVKTRFGGYDGRGNQVLSSPNWKLVTERFSAQPLYAEKIVPFQKELAVLVARDTSGLMLTYPAVETRHVRNICNMVLSPPDISSRLIRDAEEIAWETVRLLEGAGVFAVEMFLTKDDNILVNEIAPRVHNSGHHTIEANKTSQFKQHVLAVMGQPLEDTYSLSPAVMINILGERDGPVDIQGLDKVLAMPNVFPHLYGKSPTAFDRKMGHLTVLAATVAEAEAIALEARRAISI